jgi:NADH:ubiquinone oxidoreductase subunit 6 (subunit J)
MSLFTALFYIAAVLTGLSAIMVVVTQNIVRAAAWLLFTLAGTAGVYFLLAADFIGAAQLIVYVGGTLVLVVFGVMLTAQGPFVNLRTSIGEWAFSLLVGCGLYAALAVSVLATAWPSLGQEPEINAATSPTTAQLGQALLGVKEATPEANMTGIGVAERERRRVGYLLPFEIVSVHLLVVLIGAAYLARAKRRRGASA